MDANLIQSVKEIEAEANRVLDAAASRAKALDAAFDGEVEALRKEREAKLARDVEAFRAQTRRDTEAELKAIAEKAEQASARLESPDPGAVSRAEDFILQRLCEG